MQVYFLQAYHGDAIWITYHDEKATPRNILIDGGPTATYGEKDKKGKIEPGVLAETIEYIRDKGQKIDLLILTHVDNDHIQGVLAWFEEDLKATELIEKVWFNSGKLIFEYFKVRDIVENHIQLSPSEDTDTAIKEGVTFEKVIKAANICDEKIIKQGCTIDLLGVTFKIISPDENGLSALLHKWEKKEPESLTAVAKDYKISLVDHIKADRYAKDPSVHNGSSIAFILSFKRKNMLFLSDAHPEKAIDGLKHFGYTKENPLACEFVKIAHHGSKYNTKYELLELFNAPIYVISSDGSDHSPYKQCLARLINAKNKLGIYFNYPELAKQIFFQDDFDAFPDLSIVTADHKFIINE